MNINLTLFAQALMFAGFIWVIATKIWPPLSSAIEERQKKIADGLAAADRAKQELADADARVADEIQPDHRQGASAGCPDRRQGEAGRDRRSRAPESRGGSRNREPVVEGEGSVAFAGREPRREGRGKDPRSRNRRRAAS